jgi:hypothetical protein
MKAPTPAEQLRELESRIGALAKARGTTQARLRRLLGFTLTCGVLSRGVAEGIIPLYCVKGGVALELRLGLRARATKDIDIGLCAPPNELLDRIEDVLALGFGDFSFRRKSEPQRLASGTTRFIIALSYLGKAFASIDVDLNVAAEDIATESIPLLSLGDLGITEPESVICLALPEQMAQKIHALTEPPESGKQNHRFRDVLDLLLMEPLLKGEYTELAASCTRIFRGREKHAWPIGTFTFPTTWHAALTALAIQSRYEITDATDIEREFNRLLERLQNPRFIAESSI